MEKLSKESLKLRGKHWFCWAWWEIGECESLDKSEKSMKMKDKNMTFE